MFSAVDTIPTTDIEVFPLCLGGNVFGWTADRTASFAVLDGFTSHGGNFIDTADSYSAFAPGNSGGESETILGEWIGARPGIRDRVVIATKVGKLAGHEGLSRKNICAAADASLQRLKVETIDLYYAHADDPSVPIAETLAAFGELVEDGKVRHIGASNFTAPRLAEALATADANNLPRYVALQPHYSLLERSGFEGDLAQLCEREEIACFPYWGLASGFLTGKYRPGGPEIDSPRAAGAREHLDDRGLAVLAALDELAATHDTQPAAIALAWLLAKPSVLAPVASARSPQQLGPLFEAVDVKLSGDEVARLDDVSSAGTR